MTEKLTTIDIIEMILKNLGVSFTAVEEVDYFGNKVFKIKTDESSLLIGQRGDVARALNYIVKQILSKKEENTKFIIDINDYKWKRIQEIEKMAKLLADRALSLKYDVEMQPMPPYERMIVHSVLGEVENITTESIGTGRNRRVVIKYIA